MEPTNTPPNTTISATTAPGTRPQSRLRTCKAVGIGCGIAVLGPLVLLSWGIYSYFHAPQPAWAVAWSPDGQHLAAGFGGYGTGGGIPGPPQDDTVRLWNAGNFSRPPEVLTRHTARVLGVAFSPDGRWLASGDEWGTALLWDRHNLAARPTVLDDDGYPDTGSQHLVFSPDSHWLVGGGGAYHEVGVWDVTDPLTGAVGLIAPAAYGSFAGFLPDNKTLVAVSDEGRIGLWDRTAPGATPTLLPKGGGGVPGVQDVGGVSMVVIRPGGAQVAGGGEDGTVWVWDLAHPDTPPTRLPGQLLGYPSAMAFRPDGMQLVASASDAAGKGTLLVWDLADPRSAPREVHGAASTTTDLQFSPDGRWLAASGYDGSVRVWPADQLGANPRVLDR